MKYSIKNCFNAHCDHYANKHIETRRKKNLFHMRRNNLNWDNSPKNFLENKTIPIS